MNNRQKKLGYNAAEDLLRKLGMTDDETSTQNTTVNPF
jgi:HPr kinase/phosphorylase